jgi:hypothetical protein
MKRSIQIQSIVFLLISSLCAIEAHASDAPLEFNLSRKSNSVFANEKSLATQGFTSSISNSGGAQYALSQDQITGYLVSKSSAFLSPGGPGEGKTEEASPSLLIANVVGVLSNGLKPFGSIHTDAREPGNNTGFSLGVAANAHEYVGLGLSLHKFSASGDDPMRFGATVMMNMQMLNLPNSDLTVFYAKDAYFLNTALALTDELALFGTYEKEIVLDTLKASTFLVGARYKPASEVSNGFSARGFLQRSFTSPKSDTLSVGATQTNALGVAPMFKIAQDKDIEFGATYGRSFSKDLDVHFVAWTAFASYVQTF